MAVQSKRLGNPDTSRRFAHFAGALLLAISLSFAPSAANAQIVVNDLVGLETINTNLSGNYILGGAIDALDFSFIPIGTDTNPFTGTFNGNGYTISNLTINSSATNVGLFGALGTGSLVEKLNIFNSTINGGSSDGGIAGYNAGTIISSKYIGGVGGATVGGIAGTNSGTITESSAELQHLSSGLFSTTGGLVGINSGTIDSSHASLTIDQCCTIVGGLVATNESTGVIDRSYATGSIKNTNSLFPGLTAGGFVGGNAGTITRSFANTDVSGTLAGGFSAYNSGSIANSYALGPVQTYSSFTIGDAGGFTGYNIGQISSSFAAGPVSTAAGSTFVRTGGFSSTSFAGTVTNSYWDVQSTGQPQSGDGTGLTTAQLRSGTLPTGFDSSVWTATVGLYPSLNGVAGQPSLTSHDQFVAGFNLLEQTYIPPTASTTLDQLLGNQRLDLSIVDSTLIAAAQTGTSVSKNTFDAKAVNVLNIVQDLYGFVQLGVCFRTGLCAGAVDPFQLDNSSDLLQCALDGTCTIIIGDPKLITASLYELFNFVLPVLVSTADVGLFNIGDRFILNDSITGLDPSFTVLQVSDISGDTVNFFAQNITELPEMVPEPSSFLLLVTFLVFMIGIGSYCRTVACSGLPRSLR